MSVLTGLATLAGLLAFSSALWVDYAVTRQQTGKSSLRSLGFTGAMGAVSAVCVYAISADFVFASASLASASAICVAISTDLRFGLLADLTSLIIAGAALIAAPLLTPDLTRPEMLIGGAMAMSILAMAGFYSRVRRGRMGLGSGDILLAGALGLWCSPATATLGVALGAGLTLIMALILKARAQTRLPFAPGLAIGFILAFVLDKFL